MSELTQPTPEIVYCRATVKGWERLRVLYNAILLVPGVLVLWRTLDLQQRLLDMGWMTTPAYPIAPPVVLVAFSILFGVAANICYCMGPYAEFVITAWGYPLTGKRARYFLFGCGLMVSLALIGLAWVYVEFIVGIYASGGTISVP